MLTIILLVLLATLSIFLASIIVFMIYMKIKRIRKFTKNLPRTRPVTLKMILNYCIGFFDSRRDVNYELMEQYNQSVEKHNRISHFWAFFFCIIDIKDPRYIKTIYNSNLPHARLLTFPYGLLSFDGKKWHHHRKLLNPAFSSVNVKKFIPDINEKSDRLMTVLEEEYTGKTFNVARILSAFATDLFMKTSLGIEMDFINDPHHDVLDIVKEEALLINRIVYNIPRLLKAHYWIKTRLDRFLNDLMPEIRDQANCEEKDHVTFAETLLNNESNMRTRDVRNNIKGFLMASTGTVSFTTSSVLLILAMFPETQQRIHDEIIENCGYDDVDSNSFEHLKYLECVMNETMRLFPIILTFIRKVGSDLKLDDDVNLPAGSFVIIRTKEVHRDPTIWGADANEFKPDRFLPENIRKIDPYAFHPFILGPRMCIGYHFAKLLMKTVIVNIVRNFHIKTEMKFHELEFKVATVLRIKQNYMIKLEKRERN